MTYIVMADYKKLLVWQRAHELNLQMIRCASGIRGASYTSLRSQMTRAALSIPGNIVEGRGANSDIEFARYLRSAVNSASELEYHLITIGDLELLPRARCGVFIAEVVEIRRMLYGLMARVTGGPRRR